MTDISKKRVAFLLNMLFRVKPVRFKDLSFKQVNILKTSLGNVERADVGVEVFEKIAGQHVTIVFDYDHINPPSSKVKVFTKDALVKGKTGKDATQTQWGSHITSALFEVLKLPKSTCDTLFGGQQHHVWSFEMVHPDTNHDFIRYRNTDVRYYEYSGTLSKEVVDALQPFVGT